MVQQGQFSRTFATGPVCQLEADLRNSRIAVWGENRDDVYVLISLHRARSEFDAGEIVRQAEEAVVQEGTRVSITEPWLSERSWQFGHAAVNLAVAFSTRLRLGQLGNLLQLEYEVRVPRDTDVRIESTNGPIEVAAVKRPLQLHGSNGGISVEGIERDVRVESDNNQVSVKRCSGALSVTSQKGTVRIEGVGGPVEAHSENGRLSLRDLAMGLQAESENGRIEYEGEVRGDFDLKTKNGAIIVSVPASSRFELDAESRHGHVECDLPIREQPPADAPVPRVRLRSVHGQPIRIRELVAG